MPAVGAILTIALIAAPAAAARALTSRLGVMLAIAPTLSVASGVLGLLLSREFSVSAGASIALVATANNMRSSGMIHWKIVAIVSISAAIFSWLGSDWMKQLASPMLTKIFAVLLILVGVRMLWK
jgi:uncharacterized membrane protein YfcA